MPGSVLGHENIVINNRIFVLMSGRTRQPNTSTPIKDIISDSNKIVLRTTSKKQGESGTERELF